MYKILIPVLLVVLLFLSACRKMINVDLPIDKNTSETVYSNIPTAVAAMTAIYARIGAADDVFTDDYGLSIRTSLMADELTALYPEFNNDYLNNFADQTGWNMWISAYRDHIFRINSVLEGVSKSKSLPDRIKSILTGEARFTRAWIYFYLVNLYGDVPLVLTTDFKTNSNIGRSSAATVYTQIVEDLKAAQEMLTDEFLSKDLTSITIERIRPNRAAATAMLARVYLYLGKWGEAETEASKVIGNDLYELLTDPGNVFLKNSREAIWQLQPNPLDVDGGNTPDGRWLINPFNGEPFYYLSSYVLNAFEENDKRRSLWITTRPSGLIIPYKYREGWGTTVQKEYTMVLRLAEVYLIRAEARAYLNRLTGENSCLSDLNIIRSRAGITESSATTHTALLDAIAKERQTELFTEWGTRWLDLKRTRKIDIVMASVAPEKGGTWLPFKALLPIPYDEFKYNKALRGHQNEGYSEQP